MPSLSKITRAVIFCTAIAACEACRGPVSKDPIIEQYRRAACVPADETHQTREWDTTLTLRNGSKVVVTGAQMPG